MKSQLLQKCLKDQLPFTGDSDIPEAFIVGCVKDNIKEDAVPT